MNIDTRIPSSTQSAPHSARLLPGFAQEPKSGSVGCLVSKGRVPSDSRSLLMLRKWPSACPISAADSTRPRELSRDRGRWAGT